MRRLLMLVAVLALVGSACGDSGGSTTEASGGTTGETEAPTTEAAATGAQAAADACSLGETDGNLNLYNWTEYIPTGSLAEEFEVTDLVAAFEEEFGVSVTLTEYEDNETMLAQIDAGVGYDVVVPSDYMVSIMKDAGLLVKLNPAAIPNMANIAAEFTALPYDPGNLYSAPYQWGTTGIGYAYGTIDDEEGVSWGVIFDPEMSADNAGFISLLDDERETMGAALIYLGYSINSTDPGEVDEAAALIKETKDRIAALGIPPAPERWIGFLLGGRDARLLLIAIGAVFGRPTIALALVTTTSLLSLAVRLLLTRATLHGAWPGST